MSTETESSSPHSSAIEWMAKNRVASTLLILVLLVGGLFVSQRVQREVAPEVRFSTVSVSIAYPGASPDEVEQDILLVLEDTIRGVEGVRNVFSSAHEGLGQAEVQLASSANSFKVFQQIKNAIDRITTFPEHAERPSIDFAEGNAKGLSVIVYGKQNYQAIRDLAERLHSEIAKYPGISNTALGLSPRFEIAVEVPASALRAYNLDLDKIASTVRDSTTNIPGGEILSESGRVLLRSKERREYGQEFADVRLTTSEDGSIIRLGDIASIRDGFAESDVDVRFNGQPAVKIDVYRADGASPSHFENSVQNFLEDTKPSLPANTYLQLWNNSFEGFDRRMNALHLNFFVGFTLIFLCLGLFLEIRLAFWIAASVPISILGTFLMLPLTGVTINVISVFALIVALATTVDNAVIVGESIYREREEGADFLDAAYQGTRNMLMPVLFAAATSIVALSPMIFVPGTLGIYFLQIFIIGAVVYVISIVTVLFLLPAQLAERPRPSPIFDALNRPKITFEPLIERFLARGLIPFTNSILRFRYVILAFSFAIIVVFTGFIFGGYVPFSFFPRGETDAIVVQAELPIGASFANSQSVRDSLVLSFENVFRKFPGVSKGIFSQIGESLIDDTHGRKQGSNIVAVSVELNASQHNFRTSRDYARLLRNEIGVPIGVRNLLVNFLEGRTQESPIEIRLTHSSRESLEAAARALSNAIASYPGVIEVGDGLPQGKRQMEFTVSPQGRSLGITASSLGRQLRSAFFGAEALRQQRGRNEIRLMVRLPKQERSTLDTLKQLVVRGPSGAEAFLSEVADVKEISSYLDIQRQNGQRVLVVTGNVEDERVANGSVVKNIVRRELPDLMESYPGLTYSLGVKEEIKAETIHSLGTGFVVTILLIYALIAIPFRSYAQPFIIMMSLPFSVIGAVIGHLLLGHQFTLMSVFGIVALAGVVVRSSLLMVLTANSLRERKGFSAIAAIRQAQLIRFRPVLLTTIGTFVAVLPMAFESSAKSGSLSPLAVSLGFGMLCTSFISMALVPPLYVFIEDIKRRKILRR